MNIEHNQRTVHTFARLERDWDWDITRLDFNRGKLVLVIGVLQRERTTTILK